MKWYIGALAVGLLGTRAALAAGPGTSAAEFLQIPVAPVPASMAGAYAAAGGIDSALYNPAGLDWVQSPSLSAVHSEHYLGTMQEYLAFGLPTRHVGTFGLSASLFHSGAIDAIDANDSPIGSVQTYQGYAAFTYANSFTIFGPEDPLGRHPPSPVFRLGAGISPKYVYERLAGVESKAWAMDGGVLMEFFGKLRFGGMIRNFGQKQQFIADSFAMSKTYQFGAAYDWQAPVLVTQVTVSADAIYSDDAPMQLAYGGLVDAFPWLELRGGYRTHQDVGSGWTLGAGFLLDKMVNWELFKGARIDYAYIPSDPFGGDQRIGLTLRW